MSKLDERYQKAQQDLQALQEKQSAIIDQHQAVEDRFNAADQKARAVRYDAEVKQDPAAILQHTEYQTQLKESRALMAQLSGEMAQTELAIREQRALVEQLYQNTLKRDYRLLKLAALRAEMEHCRVYLQLQEAAGKMYQARHEEEQAAQHLNLNKIDPGAGIPNHGLVSAVDLPAWLEGEIRKTQEQLNQLDGVIG